MQVGSKVLNKCAKPCEFASRPLWHVGDGISTFAGPLHRNALHAHSVPVLLTAPYGRFRFRTEIGPWRLCQSALVRAGLRYEFDMDGDPLSVIYLEPSLAGKDALASLVTSGHETDGTLIGTVGHIDLLRNLYEDQRSGSWASEALSDLVCFGQRRAWRDLDMRISQAIRSVQMSASSNDPVELVAMSVGLSASRFQHLFTSEVGVPYRRYRAWRRMLLAIGQIASGASFSAAAHYSGHADQSHFSREFRRYFGAAASLGIANIRE